MYIERAPRVQARDHLYPAGESYPFRAALAHYFLISFSCPGAGEIYERNIECVRFLAYAAVLVVRDHADYLRAQCAGAGVLRQLLEPRAAALGGAGSEDQQFGRSHWDYVLPRTMPYCPSLAAMNRKTFHPVPFRISSSSPLETKR